LVTEPPAEPPEARLWRFALDLYAQPGVSQSCLLLQDRHGCDVTLLLFAAWAGAECGIALGPDDVIAARGAVAAWQAEVVKPLRAVRRRLKHGPPPAPNPRTADLRTRLQAIEIDAERIELETLAGTLPPSRAGSLPPGRSSEGAGGLAERSVAVTVNLMEVAPGVEDDADAAAALRLLAETALAL
jgi:uncharacterized protein (TIGR02444 family)